MGDQQQYQHLGDEYDSETDEDFHPEAAESNQAHDVSSSEDEDETSGVNSRVGKQARRKRASDDALDFENSGDEATIGKAKRQKRRHGNAAQDHDQGGEGGLIKTRAQRKSQQKETKALQDTTSSSIDVDTLWSQMKGSGIGAEHPTVTADATEGTTSASLSNSATGANGGEPRYDKAISEVSAAVPSYSNNEPMVTVKRRIDFAGQVTEEERQVPASSAEAKLYAEQQQQRTSQQAKDGLGTPKPGLRRPTKRKSALDQPPVQAQTRSDGDGAKKLTTLEKSKLDWAAHVDKEGIAGELDEHSRGKSDYLGRMDFLDRMSSKRVEHP